MMRDVLKLARESKEIVAIGALVGALAWLVPSSRSPGSSSVVTGPLAGAIQQGEPVASGATNTATNAMILTKLDAVAVQLDSIRRQLATLDALVRVACSQNEPRSLSLAGITCTK